MTGAKIITGIGWVYAALCVAAVAVFLAGYWGIAGSEADPVAAIYAFLLALPWVLVLTQLPDVPVWLSIAGPIAAMALNLWLLRRLAGWMERR